MFSRGVQFSLDRLPRQSSQVKRRDNFVVGLASFDHLMNSTIVRSQFVVNGRTVDHLQGLRKV